LALEDEQSDSEAEVAVPAQPSRGQRLAGVGRGMALGLGRLIPRMALFVFMIIIPLSIISYPAWRIAEKLLEYAQASTVEAKLVSIEAHQVELGQDQVSLLEARKHFDVVFMLKGDQDKIYAAVAEMSWPQPGLTRRLEAKYPIGESYTLYLLPNQSIEMEDTVAGESLTRLTGLMGLVWVASTLFFMLWSRLSHRLSKYVPRFPRALERSLLVGQLIPLVLAGGMCIVNSFNPLVINIWLFVGIYWGLALVLALSLRLLVFENPPPPPPPEPVKEEPKEKGAVKRR
jgi:hypothetical protein